MPVRLLAFEKHCLYAYQIHKLDCISRMINSMPYQRWFDFLPTNDHCHLAWLFRKQAPAERPKEFLLLDRVDLYKAIFFASQDADDCIFINFQNSRCVSNTTAINSHFDAFFFDLRHASIITIVQHKYFSWRHYFYNGIAVYIEHSCLISWWCYSDNLGN